LRFPGALLALLLTSLAAFAPPLAAQEVRSLDRERAALILRNVQREIAENYYDPGFKGIDLAARFAQAEADLTDANSLGQLFGMIALAVLELDDSHTWFLPPSRTVRVEYGWRMQAFCDECYVTAVRSLP